MSLYWNGAEVNTLMYNGIATTGVYNGNIVWGNNSQQAKTLTLYHSEGGSLTADTLTGYPGDSVNLTTAYNTYWRFSGYEVTGDGTLSNNTYTFGNTDTTICACYKVNAFTASGGFEKGSDVSCGASRTSENSYVAKYATVSYKTSNTPANWYSTSNKWNPSNASGYSTNINAKMTFTGKDGKQSSNWADVTAVVKVGNSYLNSQSYTISDGTTKTFNYSKSFSNTNQGNIICSAHLHATGYKGNGATITYIATGTNGTWTATGYAP